MTATSENENNYEVKNGALCLDFTNTTGAHLNGPAPEHMHNYADLVAWSTEKGILTSHEAEQLARQAASRPDEADAVYDRAIELREAIYRIFSTVAAGHLASQADLAILNAALDSAMVHARLVQNPDGFAWDWEVGTDSLDKMLWPVVRSAADLLVSGDLGRVRECAGDTCGWLFIDQSRNRSRQWCDMRDCGNRAKARRHYERHRKQKSA